VCNRIYVNPCEHYEGGSRAAKVTREDNYTSKTSLRKRIISRLKCVLGILGHTCLALLNGKEQRMERGDVKRGTLVRDIVKHLSPRNGREWAAKSKIRILSSLRARRARRTWPSAVGTRIHLRSSLHTTRLRVSQRIPTYPRYATIPDYLPDYQSRGTIFPRYTSLGRDAPTYGYARSKYACSDVCVRESASVIRDACIRRVCVVAYIVIRITLLTSLLRRFYVLSNVHPA